MIKKDYTEVIKKIDMVASKVYEDFIKTEIPSLQLPTRTKTNIKFDEKLNVWKYGSNTTERNAKSLDGAYMLLRTMYMADFIKEMIKIKKSSTLREMYYISEGWDLAKFHSQNESNLLAEDLYQYPDALTYPKSFDLFHTEKGSPITYPSERQQSLKSSEWVD